MTHSRRLAIAVALASACIVAPLLTGCTSTKEQHGQYRDLANQVGELAFVSDVTLTTSESLPFTVTGQMRIELEPETDREAIDQLRDLTCSIETGLTYIVLVHRFASGATLEVDSVTQCWSDRLEYVEALPALTLHEAELSHIAWDERSTEEIGDWLDISVHLTEEAVAAGAGPSAVIASELLAALDTNADRLVELEIGEISIPATTLDEARGLVSVVVDVASLYPLGKVSSEADGMFIELSTDSASVVDEVTAYLAEKHPEQEISSVVVSSETGDGGTTDQ